MQDYLQPTSNNTLLRGFLTRKRTRRSTDILGQLTFVIHDALRRNGRNLRSLTILQRIAVVKVKSKLKVQAIIDWLVKYG